MSRGLLAAACVAGLGVRAWLAQKGLHSTDVDAYHAVLDLLRGGHSVYEGTSLYNYPPLWFWTIGLLGRTSEAFGIPFDGLLRALLLVADAAVAAVLYRLAGRVGSVTPWAAAALYLANPITIWVSAVQAQFDNIFILFLLLALLVDTRGREKPATGQRPDPDRGLSWSSAICLAASIGFKQVTAFHPILWFQGPRRWRAILPWLIVSVTFLPYRNHTRAILDHVVLYRSVPRSYGFSELVLFDDRWAVPVAIASCVAAAVAAWVLRRAERCRSSLFLFLVLLVFAPGFGLQYLVWPIALGALFGGLAFWLATAAGLTWALGSEGWVALHGASQFGAQLVWLCLVLWLLQQARALGLLR